MLSTMSRQLYGQLGQAVPQAPQLDPDTLGAGATLSHAESRLKSAFNALQIAGVLAPNQPIATDLITAYQTARAGFVASVQVWIDAYNQTPIDQRNPNDPNAAPLLPPDVQVQSSGFGGFSDGVLPSQIVVTYGPMGQEQSSGLAESFYDPYFAWANAPRSGLGAFPVVPVLILIGLAIVAGTVIAVTALLTKEGSDAKIARADAERQLALAKTAQQANEVLKDQTAKCATFTDPAAVTACFAAANQGAVNVLKSLPQVQLSPRTRSIFATIGIIATVAVLGAGVFFGVRYYRQRQSAQQYPKAHGHSARSADDEE